MSNKVWTVVTVVVALGVGLGLQPVIAHNGGNSFDDHWLAAACAPATNNAQVFDTPAGPAVGHRGGRVGDLILHCNVEADDFHNWIQFHAEDNTARGSVTVTVYEQAMDPLGSRHAVATLTSTDQPGIQQAELFLEADLSPNEFNNLYYVEIVVNRTTRADRVLVYDVSLRDVL